MNGDVDGASLWSRRDCVHGGDEYFARDGMWLSLNKCLKKWRAEVDVTMERSPARVLGELFSEEYLASFVNFAEEGMCVADIRMLERNVRMLFVKSGPIGEEVRFGLHYFEIA